MRIWSWRLHLLMIVPLKRILSNSVVSILNVTDCFIREYQINLVLLLTWPNVSYILKPILGKLIKTSQLIISSGLHSQAFCVTCMQSIVRTLDRTLWPFLGIQAPASTTCLDFSRQLSQPCLSSD